MATKRTMLPTGEELPKGFESIKRLGFIDDSLYINSVVVSQLAKIELAEIEALRTKALAPIQKIVGLTDNHHSFDFETNIIPNKNASEKLLFRAYIKNVLVGYALVVIGWPHESEWVIQHVIVDPDRRLMGIGSNIVAIIEQYAHNADAAAASIFAIPIQASGIEFWRNIGYVDETHRHHISIANIDRELVVYRKEL